MAKRNRVEETVADESNVEGGTVGADAGQDASDETTEGTSNGWSGGYAEYKLAGSIAPELVGKTIKTREAKDLSQMHLLVKDGDSKHVTKLAQNQYDIIVQRRIRDVADSEEVKAILAGKSEVEINGEKLDFSEVSPEDRVAYVLQMCQDEADGYLYGQNTRSGTTRLPKAAKAAIDNQAKLVAAAANDPELAAKMAALGITL